MKNIWMSSVLMASLLISSCASMDRRSVEYRRLVKWVNENHDRAEFIKTPYVVDEMSTNAYREKFGEDNCGFNPIRAPRTQEVMKKCDEIYNNAVLSALKAKYYALDESTLEGRCHEEPLLCFDSKAFEVLLRKLHNEGIEKSRKEKLQLVEAWRTGQISNQKLENELKVNPNQFVRPKESQLASHFVGKSK